MDMICRQDTTDNINIQFCTHLSGKLTDTKSDFAFEDRISVFRNPDQMVPMVKNRVLALVIVHDHSPAKNEASSCGGIHFSGKVIISLCSMLKQSA